MITKQGAQIDPTRYLVLPRMTLATTIRLATILIALCPKELGDTVDNSAKQLSALVDEARALRVARLDRGNRYTREDVRFDSYVDGLWQLLRDRLAGWERYLAQGRARLQADPELGIDLELLEQRAARAVALRDKLFGDGVVLARINYVDQAETTRTLLELIAANGLEQELVELSDEQLLPLLKSAQRHYEAMVHERLARPPTEVIGNLNSSRAKLRHGIVMYVTALLSTLAAPEPSSVEQLEAALLPILNIRHGRRPSKGTSSKLVELDEQLSAELEQGELELEQGAQEPDEAELEA